MLGACAREDINGADSFLQRGGVHCLDLCSGNRCLSVADTEHFCDGRSCNLVIAGDHRDANSAAVAFLHGLDGFSTRRVQQTDQAQQNESIGKVSGTKTASLHLRVFKPCECQHAFALGGQPVGFLRKALAVERHRLALGGLLEITPLEDYFRSAFDEEKLFAVGRLVEGRHELVLRFERYGVDTRKRSLLSLPIHTELDREWIEGAFRRIAFYFPRTVLLDQFGVIAEQADATHEREDWFGT